MNAESTSRFSNREELEQIGEYRRLNVAAILALILGLGSVGALLHPQVWIVPILAVALGILGLALAHRRDNMGGTVTSWLAIALALFFVSTAASRIYFQRSVIYSEAEFIGRRWLQLVIDGEVEMAHQAMLHPASRQAFGLSVDDYYAMDEKAREDKDKVFSQPPAADIAALGPDAKIKLVRNITQDVDLEYAKLIRQTYRVSSPSKDPVEAMLTITRSFKPELGRAAWIVADIGKPE